MLSDDRGQVEGEFAMHVGEGSRHLSDVFKDNVMSVSRSREQCEGSEQEGYKGDRRRG